MVANRDVGIERRLGTTETHPIIKQGVFVMFHLRQWMSALTAGVLLGCSVMAMAQQPVDINTASAEVIAETLKGVGLKRAQAIVAYREKHGAFQSLTDLEAVKGVGSSTLKRNQERILFE
jgi:competence ComEA-like helix-hairpin-helix protein